MGVNQAFVFDDARIPKDQRLIGQALRERPLLNRLQVLARKSNVQPPVLAERGLRVTGVPYTASEAGGGVYKSKDAGASWYQVNLDLADTNVVGLAMDPERPKTLYVSTPTGVYKTVTGGE